MKNNSWFGLFVMAMVVALMLGLASGVMAGGGKVNNPWQPVDPSVDVCTAFLPPGLDLEDCEVLASTISGITYLCKTLDEYTVVCPDDKD